MAPREEQLQGLDVPGFRLLDQGEWLATSMSIIAVFVPVAFMKGIIGRFFFQFGLTVAFAALVSLFVSFTLDPMLSSRWHDPDIERAGKRRWLNRVLDRFNNGFEWLADSYKGIIAGALDYRKTVVLTAVAAFGSGLAVFGSLQTEFQPQMDQSEFLLKFRSAPGYERLLAPALRHRKLVLAGATTLFARSLGIIKLLRQEFIPSQDMSRG